MAELQFKNSKDILNEIREQLTDADTPVTDWTPGSVNRTFWEIVARISGEQYYMQERLYNLFFADSTELTGDKLDRRVLERGLMRKMGTRAAGQIALDRSTPAPFDISIPKETTFYTLDKTVCVKTDTDVVLVNGQSSVNVNVTAADIGAKGNLANGTALVQSGVAIVGIETIKVVSPGLLGGTDTESDDELRNRFLDAIRNPETGGSKKDYEKWASSVQGVISANCIPLARGAGTVDVIILGGNGLPGSELVKSVQNYIDEKKPVGADVLIKAPQALSIDISLTYYTDSTSDFKEPITKAIQSYITSVGVGGSFRVAQLINTILKVDEIKDISISKPVKNVTLQVDQIAALGTLAVQRG